MSGYKWHPTRDLFTDRDESIQLEEETKPQPTPDECRKVRREIYCTIEFLESKVRKLSAKVAGIQITSPDGESFMNHKLGDQLPIPLPSPEMFTAQPKPTRVDTVKQKTHSEQFKKFGKKLEGEVTRLFDFEAEKSGTNILREQQEKRRRDRQRRRERREAIRIKEQLNLLQFSGILIESNGRHIDVNEIIRKSEMVVEVPQQVTEAKNAPSTEVVVEEKPDTEVAQNTNSETPKEEEEKNNYKKDEVLVAQPEPIKPQSEPIKKVPVIKEKKIIPKQVLSAFQFNPFFEQTEDKPKKIGFHKTTDKVQKILQKEEEKELKRQEWLKEQKSKTKKSHVKVEEEVEVENNTDVKVKKDKKVKKMHKERIEKIRRLTKKEKKEAKEEALNEKISQKENKENIEKKNGAEPVEDAKKGFKKETKCKFSKYHKKQKNSANSKN